MDIWTSLGRFASFETERLILRPVTFSDADDFWQISSKPENLRFIFPVLLDRQESDRILVHQFMKEPLGIWAIADKQNDRMIGVIRLEKINSTEKTAEIGYFLNQSYWGQGYMTECLKNLVFLLFYELEMNHLTLLTHLENVASQKVAQKAGFQLEKQYRGSDRHTRKVQAYYAFGLSRKDYRYE